MQRARLDGRDAKWLTIQLLDAASRSATRAQNALPPRVFVDGRSPPRIAACTIQMPVHGPRMIAPTRSTENGAFRSVVCGGVIWMVYARVIRCRDCGVREIASRRASVVAALVAPVAALSSAKHMGSGDGCDGDGGVVGDGVGADGGVVGGAVGEGCWHKTSAVQSGGTAGADGRTTAMETVRTSCRTLRIRPTGLGSRARSRHTVPFGGLRGVEQKNSTGCLRAVGHRDRYRRVAGLRRAVRTRRSTRGSCSGSSATLSDRLGNRAHFQGCDQPRAQRAVNQQNCSWWWWWLRWWRWRWWWWRR